MHREGYPPYAFMLVRWVKGNKMSYLQELKAKSITTSLEEPQYNYNELSLESQLINSELENFQLTTKLISIENNGVIDISTESQKEGVFNKIL